MRKDIPILIVGLGSIGARHYRNLQALGYTNIRGYDVDVSRVRSLGAQNVSALTLAALKNFSIVFVCNPTALHIRVATMAVRAGCHLFVEKPLSHDTKGIAQLVAEVKKRKLTALVACNFRFDAQFIALEKVVTSGKLGKPLSALVTFTRDLGRSPGYATTYAAQKLGGGVLIDLGSHVIEYLSALFGNVAWVSAKCGNKSALKIKAEDFVAGVIEHDSGVASVFELDYYSIPKRHRLEVQCEHGAVVADFAAADNDRNDMYIEQLRHFMRCVESKDKPRYDLVRAAKVVKVLESIRASAKAGKRTKI